MRATAAPTRPWGLRCVINENIGAVLYDVAVSQFVDAARGQFMFAVPVCSRVSIYGAGVARGGPVSLVAVFRNPFDASVDEAGLWCCAFSHDELTGAQLLAISGNHGVVHIMDATTGVLERVLGGHGDEVWNVKWLASRPRFLLTASKDESTRLWNTRTGVLVAAFQGRVGHRYAVMGLAVHASDAMFATTGMDNTIKLWALDTPEMVAAMDASESAGDAAPALPPGARRRPFPYLCVEFPLFSTLAIHSDYVDDVHWLGDALLTKCVDGLESGAAPQTHNAVLWCPAVGAAAAAAGRPSAGPGVSGFRGATPHMQSLAVGGEVCVLRELQLSGASQWWMRGGVHARADGSGFRFAVGNSAGTVLLWDFNRAELAAQAAAALRSVAAMARDADAELPAAVVAAELAAVKAIHMSPAQADAWRRAAASAASAAASESAERSSGVAQAPVVSAFAGAAAAVAAAAGDEPASRGAVVGQAASDAPIVAACARALAVPAPSSQDQATPPVPEDEATAAAAAAGAAAAAVPPPETVGVAEAVTDDRTSDGAVASAAAAAAASSVSAGATCAAAGNRDGAACDVDSDDGGAAVCAAVPADLFKMKRGSARPPYAIERDPSIPLVAPRVVMQPPSGAKLEHASVRSIAFAPNGQSLVAVLGSGMLMIWDEQ